MQEPIRILYVDDCLPDRELVRHTLTRSSADFLLTEAGTRQEFEAKLVKYSYDLILGGFDIPGIEGPQLLERVKAIDPDLPVIILARTGSEEMAQETMKYGAAAYVIKSSANLQQLPNSIRIAIEEKWQKPGAGQAQPQIDFQANILQNIRDSVIVTNLKGEVIYWNDGAAAIFGYTAAEMMGRTLELLYPSQDAIEYQIDLKQIFKTGAFSSEWQGRRKDGQLIWIDAKTTVLRDATAKATGFIGVSKDITDRKQVEAALRKRTAQLETLRQIGFELTIELNINTLLNSIVSHATRLLNGTAGCFYLYRTQRDILEMTVVQGALPLSPADNPRRNEGVVGKVWATGKPLIENNYRDPAAAGDSPPVAMVAVPVNWDVQFLGVIALVANQPNAFFPEDAQLLAQLATQAAIALENARLFEVERQARDQLRNLAGYLQAAREHERARIAREVHDEFGQVLTALKLELARLTKRLPWDAASLRAKAAAMAQLIDATAQDVRRLTTELRPGLLDDLGLAAAIEWQAQEFTQRTGIRCHLNLPGRDIPLDQERATAVFRIFQETLANVARHAEATGLWVDAELHPGELLLVVQDNGRGITPDQLNAPDSLGLMGMREWAHTWAGEVIIEGMAGKGTTVTLRMPRPE